MRRKRAQKYDKRRKHCRLIALECCEFVDSNHKGTDGCIERECLDILLLLADELMQNFEFLAGRLLIFDNPAISIIEQTPELLQEAINTVNISIYMD